MHVEVLGARRLRRRHCYKRAKDLGVEHQAQLQAEHDTVKSLRAPAMRDEVGLKIHALPGSCQSLIDRQMTSQSAELVSMSADWSCMWQLAVTNN